MKAGRGSRASTACHRTVGVNYREVLRQAIRPDTSHTAETLAGVEAVLDGIQPEFASEYASRMADGERWFAMSVVPLGRSGDGAVIAHTDITDRKRAEMEAQRSRQDLAHCTRVSTMGAMTASLAHELNQPLAGILANAQAARRFLEATPPRSTSSATSWLTSSRTSSALLRLSSTCATCSRRMSSSIFC